MSRPPIAKGDALLIVDVQCDFCAGGALAVPDGDAVIPALNRWIAAAGAVGALVVASRDWHPVEHCSFKPQGGPWPEHCVQDTAGARFHPDLKLPQNTVIVSKGTAFDADAYSAFDGTGLAGFLQRHSVRRLWVGGLAEDVCVQSTVEDGCSAGFEVHLLAGATRPVFPDKVPQVLAAMRESGAIVERGA